MVPKESEEAHGNSVLFLQAFSNHSEIKLFFFLNIVFFKGSLLLLIFFLQNRESEQVWTRLVSVGLD